MTQAFKRCDKKEPPGTSRVVPSGQEAAAPRKQTGKRARCALVSEPRLEDQIPGALRSELVDVVGKGGVDLVFQILL
jgi:hypothetical protein